MKSVALVLLITFVPVLCKESLQEFEKYLKDPDFIALVKRLGLDDSDTPSSSADSSANPAAASVQPHDSGDGSCSKNYNVDTIIQTKTSLNKGATFLYSEHDVSDTEHCARKCCETDGCDVAVYQDKEKRACYLFKCKDDETNVNTCEFSAHKGYYTIFVTKSPDRATSRNSAPDETDLSDLRNSRTQKPTSSTVKPSTVSYHPHSVGNGGACVEDLNCEDIHAQCRAGTCRCRAGFLEKHGQCRKQCGEDEFRCLEPGTAVAGPDCIPHSQFCDGEAQCGDGSDEINCPTTGQTGRTGHGETQPSSAGTRPDKPGTTGLGAGSVEASGKLKSADSGTSSQTAKPKDDWPQTGAGQDSKDSSAAVTGDGDSANSDTAQKTSGSDDTGKDTASADGQPATKDDSKDDTKDDNKDDSKDDSSKDDKDSKSSPATAGTKKPVTGTNTAGSTAAPAVVGPGVQVSQEESAEFVEKMSLIEAYTTKGPIIALSLGLCFTVILLIFVGCRLRNVRRRLRKGRPLHSNEADYLINGMYL